jgi:hypothetical protein
MGLRNPAVKLGKAAAAAATATTADEAFPVEQ